MNPYFQQVKADYAVRVQKRKVKAEAERKQKLLDERNERLEHLKALSTKELIQYLRGTYIGGGSWTPNDCVWYREDEIKEVLATRPHLPNKAERKVIRSRKNVKGHRKTRGAR